MSLKRPLSLVLCTVCYWAVCCICSPSVSGETVLDFAVGPPVDKTSAAKGKKVRLVVNTAGGVVVIELFALTFLYLLTLTYCD